MKTSPIFYMGNKKRLIQKGLIDLFPKNIDTFIDLFCGGGIVSMNVEAQTYFLNDCNEIIIDLLSMFRYNNASKIINDIKDNINKFELLKGFNNKDKRETEEYKQKAKEHYNRFRDYYNNVDKTPLNLYILSYYCNNNNIRFNSKGEFNMPIGNQYFNEDKHTQKIIDGCTFLSKNNVGLSCNDFRKLNTDKLSQNDFVYLDPPYSNTLAIYNEQQGWNIQDDYDLFDLCDRLNEKGIKWGLSNVFKNKGIENTHLIEWSKNYKVHKFSDFTYVSCGKGNAETEEVYICNY